MIEQFRNSIETMKMQLIAAHPEQFRGYGLSNGKGPRMTELRNQAQWVALEEAERVQRLVVEKARVMIEQAHNEYEAAKVYHQHNIKTFTELTLNWSPERVLSKNKDFDKLCRALSNEKVWRALNRKERRFIADAVRLK